MGWNDHVEYEQMQCQDCGEDDVWEFWDDVAKARYGGRIGQMLNIDLTTDGRCPHCGSTNGKPIEED
jgi:hypothetical protein